MSRKYASWAVVRGLFWLVAVGLTLLSRAAFALEPPELRGRVTDLAELMSESEESRVNERLAAHEKATGHQFAVLTIPSLEGDPLEDFSIRTVQKWKLGNAKVDDGLLLLVAAKERKVRIEVGYGLEGHLTDVVTSRVIRRSIVPAFRNKDYATGIERGLGELLRADGEKGQSATASEERSPERRGSPFLLLFLVPFIPLLLLLRRGGGGGLGGGFGGWGTSHGYSGGHSWGGGGGSWGGGGGGGGFSGGGGGFGGGGASGSW